MPDLSSLTQGSSSRPPQWEHEVLSAGQPGKAFWPFKIHLLCACDDTVDVVFYACSISFNILTNTFSSYTHSWEQFLIIVCHHIIWTYSVYLAVLLWICRLYPIWTIVNNIKYFCKTCSHLWLFPWINSMTFFGIRTSEFLCNRVLTFLRTLRLITKLFPILSAHFIVPCQHKMFSFISMPQFLYL